MSQINFSVTSVQLTKWGRKCISPVFQIPAFLRLKWHAKFVMGHWGMICTQWGNTWRICTKWSWKTTLGNVFYKTPKNQCRWHVFWWHQMALIIAITFIATSALSTIMKMLHWIFTFSWPLYTFWSLIDAAVNLSILDLKISSSRFSFIICNPILKITSSLFTSSASLTPFKRDHTSTDLFSICCREEVLFCISTGYI